MDSSTIGDRFCFAFFDGLGDEELEAAPEAVELAMRSG